MWQSVETGNQCGVFSFLFDYFIFVQILFFRYLKFSIYRSDFISSKSEKSSHENFHSILKVYFETCQLHRTNDFLIYIFEIKYAMR